MKTKWHAHMAITCSLILLALSCQKSLPDAVISQPAVLTDSIQTNVADTTLPFPHTYSVQCVDGPNYGDSIIYAQSPTPGHDYIVTPSNPGLGTYLAWPNGMVIDSKTGAINISKSATGLRYYIGFIRTGSKDTCVGTLILAGSSYMDSIYSLDNNKTASPYFNANPGLTSICGQGNGCHFDISHKGSGKGVTLDPSTGVMDLEKTKDIFGSHPFNGEFIDVNMDYSLSDQSNNAIQQMSVRFIYFDKSSQIPQWLLDFIKNRRDNTLQDVPIINDGGNPKPTLIVITRVK